MINLTSKRFSNPSRLIHMRLTALLSGGKDSIYAAYIAKKSGHNIISIISTISKNPDSYMFHVPNISLVKLQAESMGIPIIFIETEGKKEKELEDLKSILAKISATANYILPKIEKSNAICPSCGTRFDCNPTGNCWCKTEEYRLPIKLPVGDLKNCLCPQCLKQYTQVDGVVTGAIASQYQKSRIDKICREVGLKSIAPLWGRNHEELLREMLKDGFRIIITAVATGGLEEDWLGRELDSEAIEELISLSRKHRFSPIGEGGEFETFVIDCPLFFKAINIISATSEWDDSSRSGVYKIEKAELVKK